MLVNGVRSEKVMVNVTGVELHNAVVKAVHTKFPRLRDHEIDGFGLLKYLPAHGNGESGAPATAEEVVVVKMLDELWKLLKDVI